MSKKAKKTKLSVYTDDDGQQAIYVNGKLELSDDSIYGPDVVKVADGRLVRMRSELLDASLDEWPESESELKKMIKGFRARIKEEAAWDRTMENAIVDSGQNIDWKPEIGDWVRIKMCDPSCHGGCWVTGMEYLDGQIRRVEELITDGSGIVVDCFWLCDRCIEPWEPKVGEWVKVIRKNSMNHGMVGLVKRDDGKHGDPYYVENESGMGFGWYTLEFLEPAPPPDHIADANKKVNSSEAPNSSLSVAELVKRLSKAMQQDQDLAWTWHCNIAMPSQDEGVDHKTANLAAARFMRIAFGVDVTTFAEWKSFDWNKKPVEVPNNSIPDPGPGYRLLSKDPPENVVNGDEFLGVLGRWEESENWRGGGVQSPSLYYRRKIEDPAINKPIPESQGHPDHVEGVWIEEADPYAGRKIEQPAEAPKHEYREPTYADLVNGPIEVEVCNDKTLEVNWQKRILYAVLPTKCVLPYIAASPEDSKFFNGWKLARVKVR